MMNKNFEELTLVALKEVAKNKGLKGYSKMRKAELIELLKNTEVKGEDVKMENKVVNNGEVLVNGGNVEMKFVDGKLVNVAAPVVVEEVRGMNRLNFAKISKLDEKQQTTMLKYFADKAKRQSRLAFNIIKKESKNIKTVNMIRVEFDYEWKVIGKSKVAVLTREAFVQPAQESALIRQCNVVKGKLADGIMVANGDMTTDIITISFSQNLINGSKTAGPLFSEAINSVLEQQLSVDVNNKKELKLLYNANTGLVKFYEDGMEIKECEKVLTYKFMGITPSGLRSASIICAATHISTSSVKNLCVDRRNILLDKAMDGAFSYNFLDGNKFKTVKKLDKLFKDSTRITQCAPGSQDIMKMENYVVAKNIAMKAKFFNVLAQKVTDGNVFISVEALLEKYFKVKNIPVKYGDVNGTCAQYRGASLKCSGTAKRRKHIAFVSKKAFADDNIAFVVVDGKRYSKDAFLALDKEVQDKFWNNIEMLADLNAIKLEFFNPVFTLTKLKEAYVSDSESNMVVNMAMLQTAPQETIDLLVSRGRKQLAKIFRELGASFDVDDKGNIIPAGELDVESTKRINNAAQFIDYIYSCDPVKVLAMLPGVIKSKMNNIIKGARRMVNELKIDIDSVYSVVQSDPAAILGVNILAEDECFSIAFELEGIEIVSAVRHPISSTFAVSTFKVVTLEEVLRRINALPIGELSKEYIADAFMNAKGYVILPASEYLMEKHDGMDWDIDAMQFILDPEVVSILRRIPNIGSNISSENDWMRKTELNAELAIIERNFARPSFEKTNPDAGKDNSNAGNTSTAKAMEAIVSSYVSYNYSYSHVGNFVAKDFFLLDVANVGQIATAFYNNVCIRSAIKSEYVSTEVKEAIAKEFKNYYNCSGKKKYATVIEEMVDANSSKIVYDSNKLDCCEAIFRFAESNGTIEELDAFLLDCILLNRFLAETSIDAAKNRYFVYNMFNHAAIVRACGSDKNMEIKVTEDNSEANKIFADRYAKMGLTVLSDNNFFNVDMLHSFRKGATLDKLEEARANAIMDAKLTGRNPKDVALSVLDPLGVIRIKLQNFVNDLIVLTSKQLEAYVTSASSRMTRTAIIEEARALSNYGEIAACVYGVRNAYAAITTSAKEAVEFEEKSAKEYLKTVAVQGCRNMVTLGLSDVDAYTIGLVVVATMANDEGTKNVNPALFKVFEKEIIAFLAAKGLDNVGIVGEELMYAKNENNIVKLDTLVGQTIEIAEGKACLEDGTIIVAENKKAEITGQITVVNGKYTVVAAREFAEDNLSVGAYLNLDSRYLNIVGMTNAKNPNKFEASIYKVKDMKIAGNEYFNVVIGYNEAGEYRIEGCISGNKLMKESLATLELTASNFSVFTSKSGKKVFFLDGKDCEEMLQAMSAMVDEEICFENPEMPSFDHSDVNFTSAPIMNEEVAASLEDYSFDYSSFGFEEPVIS